MTTKVTQDYGIRPDVDKDPADDSYQEFAQRPTWSRGMGVELQKHSELMRPWEHDDFPEMEHYYPTPLGGWPDTILENRTVEFSPSGGGCIISGFGPLYCDGYIEFHAAVHQCPPGVGQLSCIGLQQWSVVSTDPSGLVDRTEFNPSWVRPFRVYPATEWPAWPDASMAKITVEMTDAVGNVCRETISVFCRSKDCCTGPTYVVMTLDAANTDDTIDDSTPATVTVKDGCPPYTWAVSGTGFSIVPDGASTSLSAVVSAASGCGVATVTVTDACNTTITKKIRHTSGVWSAQTTGCPTGERSDATCTYSAPWWVCVLITEEYKVEESLQMHSTGSPTCATVVNYPNLGDTVVEYCNYYCNQQGYAAYVPCLESSPTLSWCGSACACCIWGGYTRCLIPYSVKYRTWGCS